MDHAGSLSGVFKAPLQVDHEDSITRTQCYWSSHKLAPDCDLQIHARLESVSWPALKRGKLKGSRAAIKRGPLGLPIPTRTRSFVGSY